MHCTGDVDFGGVESEVRFVGAVRVGSGKTRLPREQGGLCYFPNAVSVHKNTKHRDVGGYGQPDIESMDAQQIGCRCGPNRI